MLLLFFLSFTSCASWRIGRNRSHWKNIFPCSIEEVAGYDEVMLFGLGLKHLALGPEFIQSGLI